MVRRATSITSLRLMALIFILGVAACDSADDLTSGADSLRADTSEDIGVPVLRDVAHDEDQWTAIDTAAGPDLRADTATPPDSGRPDTTSADTAVPMDTSTTGDAGPDADQPPSDIFVGPDLTGRDVSDTGGPDVSLPPLDVHVDVPPVACAGGEGSPCDDGLDCTLDDRCVAGVCEGTPNHGRCDLGNPCAESYCVPARGGCVDWSIADGTACPGASACTEGYCLGGECVGVGSCDDDTICTSDACETGVCVHAPSAPQGEPAPQFEMIDVNPYSATVGQTFRSSEMAGSIALLIFAAPNCLPCRDQAESARLTYANYVDSPDVFFATVSVYGDVQDEEAYASHDADGEEPLLTLWPILKDSPTERVWARYCADNNYVAIIDPDGFVAYYREVNFTDPPFRNEVEQFIADLRERHAAR